MTDYNEFEFDLEDWSRHEFGGLRRPEKNDSIVLGVCALSKKAKSAPMKEILQRIRRFGFRIAVFEERVILSEPVEKWPLCHGLIAFFSEGFPLDKAEEYVALRKPFLVNEIKPQHLLKDRRHVMKLMEKFGVPTPEHVVMNRSTDSPSGFPVDVNQECDLEEHDDYIVLNGVRMDKPFVEKPVDGDDHNIRIYYPRAFGGGSCQLFRKVENRSSEFFPELNNIRRDGSYIYESFLRTEGSDVKVYTVTGSYAHSEARKSPAIDGVVRRNEEGFEVRYPVLLNAVEKEIANLIVHATGQRVCGFDVLRSDSKSFVCDVNGWSFVKNNHKYYDDFALIMCDLLRKAMGVTSLPRFMPMNHSGNVSFDDDTDTDQELNGDSLGNVKGLQEEPGPGETSMHEELRAVIAVVRHGDRTPKQKLKIITRNPSLLGLFEKYGNPFGKEELKLKSATQLSDVLAIIVKRIEHAQILGAEEEDSDSEERNLFEMLLQARTVLEMHGTFRGINRKVQLKPMEWHPESGKVTVAQFVLKWGGVLTYPGRHQAELLGQSFRHKLYPFDGLLRLHSTYRHDLKIYSSNEGRVQVTAAAFAKGMLQLEGHLTPILTSLVRKSNDVDVLLDDSTDAKAPIEAVKAKLHAMLESRVPSKEEMTRKTAPTGAKSLTRALEHLDFNPRQKMALLATAISGLVKQLRIVVKTHRERYGINSGSAGVADTNKLLDERGNSASESDMESEDVSEGGSAAASLARQESERVIQSILAPENGTPLLMSLHRWHKLEKDFYNRRKDKYDLSKIPDISDSVKYDLLHNSYILQLKPANLLKVYKLSKHLADIVVPQEYGITAAEKKRIGSRVAKSLIEKIRADFAHTVAYCTYGQSNSGNTATAASISKHSKRPPLLKGDGSVSNLNLLPVPTQQLGSSTEVLAENSGGESAAEVNSVGSEETFHRLDRRFARSLGIKSSDRMVRTRLYFTSESHLHALLNVIRYSAAESADVDVDQIETPQISQESLEKLNDIDELNYLTHIVFRLFEVAPSGRSFRRRKTGESGESVEEGKFPSRFRVSVAISPGVEVHLDDTQNGKVAKQGVDVESPDATNSASSAFSYGSRAKIQLLPCSPMIPIFEDLEYNELHRVFEKSLLDVHSDLSNDPGSPNPNVKI